MRIFLGIDPGKTGAVAAVKPMCDDVIVYENDEFIRRFYRDFFAITQSDQHELIVAIEKPIYAKNEKNPLTGKWEGVTNANSLARQWENFGFWKGFFTPFKVTVREVSPQTWGHGFKFNKKEKQKKAVERYMRERYPEKVLGPRGGYKDGRGDALGIARWNMETTLTNEKIENAV